MSDDTRTTIQALIRESPPEVQKVVGEVLRLEKEKLHLANPRGIVEDISDLVRRLVS